MTTAICARNRRIAASTSSSGAGPGTYGQRPRIARGDRLVRDEVPEDFLDVEAADDVVEVAAVDRISRVRVRADDGAELVGLGADRDADEQDPRHHHLTRGPIAELEQVAQDLPGLATQQAAFLALLDDELQLLGRVIPLALDLAALDADQSAAGGCRRRSTRRRAAGWRAGVP